MKASALDQAGPRILLLLKALEEDLGQGLLDRRDRLRRVVMRDWIAYRGEASGLAFAELRPRRAHVEIFVLPSPADLGNLGRVVSEVPSSRGWGWFRGRFILRPGDGQDLALRVLLASHAQSLGRRRQMLSNRPRMPRGHRGSPKLASCLRQITRG